MGSVSPELSLNLSPTYVPKTIGVFLGEISMMGSVSGKETKLDEYIKRLEEEMKKIDAFKRELPLCMLLITDAIAALKEEAMQCSRARPVMEEFLPVMRSSDDDQNLRVENERDVRDKKDWLSSVQLWNSNGSTNSNREAKERTEKDDLSATESSFLAYKNGGEAFAPFKGISGFSPPPLTTTTMMVKEKENNQPGSSPGLSLLPPEMKTISNEPSSYFLNSKNSGGSGRGVLSSVTTSNQLNLQTTNSPQPPTRKQRRCWSPELHRLFVNALQQLGGCHVATPKQIRELMKVEGLTNDEVKSHLQKYRLHTRRIPTSASATSGQPVVVLGGIWVPKDQRGNSKPSTSQSGSPQGPLQMSGTGGGIDDSVEDDDQDRRSESYSWKGHLYKPCEDDA